MKRLLYLIFLLIQTLILSGQKGYYLKDNLMTTGVQVISKGPIQNAQQCQIELYNKTLIFSPDELKEYGLNDGRVYISRTIKISDEEKNVFLERLIEGKISLYYYKDKNGERIFLEKDSSQLVEV